jgi:aconitate hydratase
VKKRRHLSEEKQVGLNLVEKIINRHLVEGRIFAGERIKVAVDQVLTQDATGTLTYLQFEALGIPRIKTPLAVSYVDHNILQTSFRNPDDHLYLQTAAARYGAYFSAPGNGICHQVHLERFAAPGKILLGSDSHTPTAGGMGMIAMGTGGLDIAAVMGGSGYELSLPKVRRVYLSGRLNKPWVTAMDVILELLRRLTVKGGVGWIMEYGGPGVSGLSLTERATITNMGAELGLTCSIFPSDERTYSFLLAQGRENDWLELTADPDAGYDEELELDLGVLEPLIAKPHSPDNVVPLRELKGQKVDQVCVGSCTNSSYEVLKSIAAILKGHTLNPKVSMSINPGSKQVYEMLAKEGDLYHLVAAGVRILEAACGPCIGMGQTPGTDAVSVRSFNRNFHGRCGNRNAGVYLCNPLVATLTALAGEIVDPNESGIQLDEVAEPKHFLINDNRLIPPVSAAEQVQVIRGPNIKQVPVKQPLEDDITCRVLLKLGDGVSTDDIMPAGSQILPFRSNIPAIADFVFSNLDPGFALRAKKLGGGVIVGGENYGQGSSREHAALAPMYLGVKAVIAKSFARIHRNNLINYGILPLEFDNPAGYAALEQGDEVSISQLKESIKKGAQTLTLHNKTRGGEILLKVNLSPREREMILLGGLLAYIKQN